MSRGRLLLCAGSRLAVYAAALFVLREATVPALAASLALRTPAASPVMALVVVVLLLGVVLEVVDGAVRWR